MTNEKIAALLATSKDRQYDFERIHSLLGELADEMDSLRFEALSNFGSQFTFNDEHASQFWSDMETACEGIGGAMNELQSLSARETLRQGKLCEIRRRQNG